MRAVKPQSINELMQRVNTIAGMTLGQLAQQYQFNDYQIYYYSQSEDTIINCILSNKKKMLDYLI